MTRKVLHIIILITVAMLLIFGCGHRKSPTGGKKDTVKPEILAITPTELSDISDSDIEIVFSKPIERSTIISGVYIYPPIQQKKYKWDKNVLTIKILEKLEDNTNYFFTFNTSIKGEHKNNLDKQYTFVFASGKLSVNKISGKFKWEDANDEKMKVNFNLMTSDSTFIIHRIIDTPTFEFRNLNNIDHIVEAYADKNKNEKYDYGDEPYYFTNVEAAKFSSIVAEMAYEDTLKPTIKSARSVWNNQVVFDFDETVIDYAKVEITTKDSIPAKLPVIATHLNKTELTLITAPMDTLQYIANFFNVKDKKKNISDSLFIVFDGSALRDSIPPEVVNSFPGNGETINESKPVFKLEFDEIVLRGNVTANLQDIEKKMNIALKVVKADSKIINLIPLKKLENYSTYELSVQVKDQANNSMAEEYKIKFIVIVR